MAANVASLRRKHALSASAYISLALGFQLEIMHNINMTVHRAGRRRYDTIPVRVIQFNGYCYTAFIRSVEIGLLEDVLDANLERLAEISEWIIARIQYEQNYSDYEPPTPSFDYSRSINSN